MKIGDHVRFVRHAESDPELQAFLEIGDEIVLCKPPESGDCGLWTVERLSDGLVEAVFPEEVEVIV